MKNKYVFLGDSITEWGNWNELLPHFDILNLGIAGDKTYQVIDRIKEATLNCDKLFLLIGINDLGEGRGIGETIETYQNLIDLLKSKISSEKINLISILPIDESIWDTSTFSNSDIAELNFEILVFALVNELNYIDLNSSFLDSNSKVKSEFYTDGLHLNDSGYKAYSKELQKYLR